MQTGPRSYERTARILSRMLERTTMWRHAGEFPRKVRALPRPREVLEIGAGGTAAHDRTMPQFPNFRHPASTMESKSRPTDQCPRPAVMFAAAWMRPGRDWLDRVVSRPVGTGDSDDIAVDIGSEDGRRVASG